jgi:uncharacterized RDD family membrane protein YckC
MTEVMADEPPAGMAPLATLGQRLLARAIDTAVLVAVGVLVSWIALGGDFSNARNSSYGKQALIGVLGYVLYFALEGAMTAARGQTLGKVALRIRVARLVDGAVPGRAGWARAAVYVLPGALSVILIGPLFWLLNSLWCTWDRPYRQCLHDKAARTVVVTAV